MVWGALCFTSQSLAEKAPCVHRGWPSSVPGGTPLWGPRLGKTLKCEWDFLTPRQAGPFVHGGGISTGAPKGDDGSHSQGCACARCWACFLCTLSTSPPNLTEEKAGHFPIVHIGEETAQDGHTHLTECWLGRDPVGCSDHAVPGTR